MSVPGKLPHWKNYFALDPCHRPAVGRITVELIEALAIPSFNGKAEPYVKATITGYDSDMRWELKEWLPSKRFSLCSNFCIGTLSPVWRGQGRKGGELLTLPVISTAGAVLRLEVMHYDVMTNARGKDAVLGVVEIPLSDMANANLRTNDEKENSDEGKRRISYDGYCNRWYRLQSPITRNNTFAAMSKPIANPHLDESNLEHCTLRKESNKRKIKRPNIAQSLEEIGHRVKNWGWAPVDWVSSLLSIDIPHRHPETMCVQHRSRSSIHVRLKLNCNEIGDLLSHLWFPPVEPYTPVPPYDPQILWKNVICAQQQIKPYQNVVKFIEDAVKWRHTPKICTVSYVIFAFHIMFLPSCLYLLHIYLLVFLGVRLQKVMRIKDHTESAKEKTTEEIQKSDSFCSSLGQSIVSEEDLCDAEKPSKQNVPTEPCAASLTHEKSGNSKSAVSASPSLENKIHHIREMEDDRASKKNDDTVRLNKAVEWIARKVGDNRGLEIAQFKIGQFGRNITNINSFWDGSSPPKTLVAIIAIVFSFLMHCYFSWRLLWIIGTASSFFGSSPFFIRRSRNCLGMWRGVIKVMRRRHLHELEITKKGGYLDATI